MNRKMGGTVATILFVAGAIWVGSNSSAVIVQVWRVWYGHHVKWNGIDVEINDQEYFLPTAKSGKDLFIGDWKYKSINIILHSGSRTSSHQRAFVLDYCRPGECRETSEHAYIVDGHLVIAFTFVKLYADSNVTTFHQYIVIDGADAWIEYLGDKLRYPVHKSTIDSLIKKIASKKN